ncbi:MAG: fumarate hydratase [Clostridiales bacterium]|nr:fumarate hydratase [Clostridiales bacterium]
MHTLSLIDACDITRAVKELCIEACTRLPGQVVSLLENARQKETFAPARETLELISKNASIARQTGVPICQDTGMAVVFAYVGQDVHITGGLLYDAVNEGVRQGYIDGYLRKSVVGDPVRRGNTGDNTPAILHIRNVPGNTLRLVVSPKGFGSENMSRVAMLTPAQGLEGVKEFVIDTVRKAGSNPCPPMMLGVGIGGDFEQVAMLAKEALVFSQPHADPYYRALEEELLAAVNALGIGPQGFGGLTTALSLHIRTAPTHIAGLPVAVNVGCHVTRHAERILEGLPCTLNRKEDAPCL